MREGELRGILGLAFRAGQLVPGAEMSLQLIRDGKAALVLVDTAAAANTAKKLSDACAYRGVSMCRLPEGELARALGRPEMAAAALKRGNFAKRAEELCGERPGDQTGTKNAEELG
ncbi:MAG TPA: ribosomal L7Ae/L30e/S12e/Gadd45 family protein [Candidatus Limnocylindria bacterium]|nr:ribosomal L7Ae/L30e/S12e/Gadd45 family protein [Candidatus Limnocylindria bacterium]